MFIYIFIPGKTRQLDKVSTKRSQRELMEAYLPSASAIAQNIVRGFIVGDIKPFIVWDRAGPQSGNGWVGWNRNTVTLEEVMQRLFLQANCGDYFPIQTTLTVLQALMPWS